MSSLDRAHYDFLLRFYSNRGPTSYRFRDRRRFQSKIAKFSHPLYFAPLLKGFPLELGTGSGVRKLEWSCYRADKEVWRYLQPSGYNTPTWQTDRQTYGRTDTGRQQRPRLRIALRGKNVKIPTKNHGSAPRTQTENVPIEHWTVYLVRRCYQMVFLLRYVSF